MINFTVGPVQMSEKIREIGKQQIPYFRTEEFSNMMKENERFLCEIAGASEEDKAIFLTGSGTFAMEAGVLNIFSKKDKILVINGGSFGQRFVDICKVLELDFYEVKLDYGKKLSREILEEHKNKGITALLVNACETSTGLLYDMEMISNFCAENNIFLFVDAISAFISDNIPFSKFKIGAMVIGSQKALALPPGLSMIILSKEAEKRILSNEVKSLYLDLKNVLKNASRGQTPFTPAVQILLQLNMRLKEIKEKGLENERKKIKLLAEDFRKKINKLPFDIFPENSSNTLTAITLQKGDPYELFLILKDKYNIWICPNGEPLKNKIVRIGHIGDLTVQDNDKLIEAIKDIYDKNIL